MVHDSVFPWTGVIVEQFSLSVDLNFYQANITRNIYRASSSVASGSRLACSSQRLCSNEEYHRRDSIFSNLKDSVHVGMVTLYVTIFIRSVENLIVSPHQGLHLTSTRQ